MLNSVLDSMTEELIELDKHASTPEPPAPHKEQPYIIPAAEVAEELISLYENLKPIPRSPGLFNILQWIERFSIMIKFFYRNFHPDDPRIDQYNDFLIEIKKVGLKTMKTYNTLKGLYYNENGLNQSMADNVYIFVLQKRGRARL